MCMARHDAALLDQRRLISLVVFGQPLASYSGSPASHVLRFPSAPQAGSEPTAPSSDGGPAPQRGTTTGSPARFRCMAAPGRSPSGAQPPRYVIECVAAAVRSSRLSPAFRHSQRLGLPRLRAAASVHLPCRHTGHQLDRHVLASLGDVWCGRYPWASPTAASGFN